METVLEIGLIESVIPKGLLDVQTGNNPDCPGCALEQRSKVQIKFHKCLNAAVQVNSKNAAKVTSLMEAQMYTCQLISDMILCHDKPEVSLDLCHSEKEIINMKDLLISKQISEYAKNDIGIRIEECTEVKEYLESGRANNIYKTVKVFCSAEDVKDETKYDCN